MPKYPHYELSCANPSLSVLLRAPDLGERHTVELNAVINRTRFGILRMTKNPVYPVNQTWQYTFSVLRQSAYEVEPDFDSVEDVRDFLEQTAGRQIAITWHISAILAEVKAGFITSPVNEIITVKEPCNYRVGFRFLLKNEWEEYYDMETEDSIQIIDEDSVDMVVEAL